MTDHFRPLKLNPCPITWTAHSDDVLAAWSDPTSVYPDYAFAGELQVRESDDGYASALFRLWPVARVAVRWIPHQTSFPAFSQVRVSRDFEVEEEMVTWITRAVREETHYHVANSLQYWKYRLAVVALALAWRVVVEDCGKLLGRAGERAMVHAHEFAEWDSKTGLPARLKRPLIDMTDPGSYIAIEDW